MADIAIVPASVVPGESAAQIEVVTAGATIVEANLLYFDTGTTSYKLSDCTAPATAKVERIALSSGGSGDPITVQRPGTTVELGVTMTAGQPLFLSEAGGMMPAADLTTGDIPVVVGFATSADVSKFLFRVLASTYVLG